MVHPTGFEPVASSSARMRSIQLSYGCAGRSILSALPLFVSPQIYAGWHEAILKILFASLDDRSCARLSDHLAS